MNYRLDRRRGQRQHDDDDDDTAAAAAAESQCQLLMPGVPVQAAVQQRSTGTGEAASAAFIRYRALRLPRYQSHLLFSTT